MRITFLQAPLGRPEPLVYPLGIATLAGTLPDHHELQLLDPNRIGLDRTEQEVRDFSPQIICLSIRNLDSQIRRDLFYYYLYLKDFIVQLNSWTEDTVIIAGGSGFSLFPSRIMDENPAVDFGVFLEADVVLPELIENLDQPGTISGVYYRSEGTNHYTGDPDLPPVESFGRPRYDLLDPKHYEKNGGVGVQTKRGCPLSCVYCTYPHLNGREFRSLPVQQVVEELQILSRDYDVHEVTFVDGVFNIPKSRTIQLLNEIQKAGLKINWRGWFTEKGFDRELAVLCRDTGCPEFSFSPDGFSEKTLNALGKNISVSDIHRIFNIARETPGIRVAFNFFWNPPEQTVGTWIRMMVFALRCKLVLGKQAGGIIFGNARIEPHTPLLKRAIEDGLIEEDTDLLPPTQELLEDAFYSNPGTRILDWFYSIYTGLWKLKNKLKK